MLKNGKSFLKVFKKGFIWLKDNANTGYQCIHNLYVLIIKTSNLLLIELFSAQWLHIEIFIKTVIYGTTNYYCRRLKVYYYFYRYIINIKLIN